MLTSPPGWPSRANAAGATKMGREDEKERILVVGEACDTLFNLPEAISYGYRVRTPQKRDFDAILPGCGRVYWVEGA